MYIVVQLQSNVRRISKYDFIDNCKFQFHVIEKKILWSCCLIFIILIMVQHVANTELKHVMSSAQWLLAWRYYNAGKVLVFIGEGLY